MNVEFLNPFVFACLRVLGSEAGLKKSVPGKPYLIQGDATVNAVNVVIGVTGKIQGMVIYGTELSIAKGITLAMAGVVLPIADPVSMSALGELGNVMTGVASAFLEEAGYPCRISPPAIVLGTGYRLARSSLPMVVVPITTELGDVRIYLSLNEVK